MTIRNGMDGTVLLLGGKKSAVDNKKSTPAGASASPSLVHLLGCTLQACKPCGCPGQQRMSPETVTETSVVCWTGDHT